MMQRNPMQTFLGTNFQFSQCLNSFIVKKNRVFVQSETPRGLPANLAKKSMHLFRIDIYLLFKKGKENAKLTKLVNVF